MQAVKSQNSQLFKFSFFLISVVTLIFNSNVFDPFNSPKLWVLTLGAAWLLGWVAFFLIRQFKDANVDLRKNSVFIIITFFVASNLWAFVFSKVKYTAFFGDNLRRNGMLAYLCLTVLLLAVYFSYQISYTKLFYSGLLVVAGIEGSYGLMQHTGNDFMKWQNQYNPIIGTVGNPNFSAALMSIFAVILLTGVFISNFGKLFKFLLFSVGCFLILIIYFTDAKQGILSLLIALGIFTAIWSKKFGKKIQILISFIIFLFFLLGIFGIFQKGPLTQALYKPSVSLRGFYWRSGIQMFLHNPITGIGLDNYADYFKLYREPEFGYRQGFQLTSSNAHNVYIQQFATGGLFLGISYLIIVLFVIYRVAKALRENYPNRFIILSIFSGWIAFQSQSLVSIDNIGLSVWGWFLSGMLIKLTESQSNSPEKSTKVRINKVSGIQLAVSSLTLFLAFMTVANLYSIESQMLKFRNTQPSNSSGYLSSLKNLAERSLAEPSFKFQIALTLANQGQINDSRVILEKLMNSDKPNVDYRIFSSQIYEAEGNIVKALEERKIVNKFDPWNLNNKFVLAGYYEKLNDIKNAKALYSEVAKAPANQPEVKQAQDALTRIG